MIGCRGLTLGCRREQFCNLVHIMIFIQNLAVFHDWIPVKPNDDVVMPGFAPSGVISWMIDKEMYWLLSLSVITD